MKIQIGKIYWDLEICRKSKKIPLLRLRHIFIQQIFPRRKFQNPVSGTNLKNFYQLQINSIDNLKQIRIQSTHPTHGMLMERMNATKRLLTTFVISNVYLVTKICKKFNFHYGFGGKTKTGRAKKYCQMGWIGCLCYLAGSSKCHCGN